MRLAAICMHIARSHIEHVEAVARLCIGEPLCIRISIILMFGNILMRTCKEYGVIALNLAVCRLKIEGGCPHFKRYITE